MYENNTDQDCLLITFLYPFVEHFFLLRIIMSAKLTKLLRRKITFYTKPSIQDHIIWRRSWDLKILLHLTLKIRRERASTWERQMSWKYGYGVFYKATFWSVDEIAIFRERTPSGKCVTCLYSLSIFKFFTLQTNRWCGFDLCNIIYLTRIPSYIILYWHI